MKFPHVVLAIYILTLFLGGCTKLKSKDHENLTSDEASIEGGSENDTAETSNKADSGERLDSSTTDISRTDSDTSDEEIQCNSDELVCDDSCVPNDEKNCGECDRDCTALENVIGPIECEDGTCLLTPSSCGAGWTDCNDDSEDGCETNITEAKNCGSCGNDCSETAKPFCAPIEDDGYECTTDCPSDAPTLCGDSCVNIENSASHCGG